MSETTFYASMMKRARNNDEVTTLKALLIKIQECSYACYEIDAT